MAGHGELKKSFEDFASHGKTGAKKTEMDGKNWSKCCKDCKIIDGKKVTSTDVDILFSKIKSKGARVITLKQFEDGLLQLAEKKGISSEEMFKLVAAHSPENTGTTKTSKTGGVAKMTDSSQYTGSHKERFTADGKGKGIAGREDLSDNSGYVGNYKGQNTYDDKVKK